MAKKRKSRWGIWLGAAALGTAAYYYYKNRVPKFKILEFNQGQRTVKWQYGEITNVATAGQNNTYSSSPNSDFYVNVGPIEHEGKTIGIRFNFLGKDTREPQFVYFE